MFNSKKSNNQIWEQALVNKFKTRPIITFFIAFLLLFLPFVILARIYGVPILFGPDSELRVKVPHLFAWPPTWTAFGMSGFFSLMIAIEQYGQKQKAEMEIEFFNYFSNNDQVLQILHTVNPKQRRRLKGITIVGLFLGCITAYHLVIVPAADLKELLLTPRPWFALVGIGLVTFSIRGVFLAVFEHVKLKEAIGRAKLVDLFGNSPQSSFVRIAMRRLLSWMCIIGFSCVFLIRGEDISVVAWPWIFIATFMSAFSFLSAIDIGHKLISKHKTEELETLNDRILKLTEDGIRDSVSAMMLMTFLALENRVKNIPEWKISMPIAFRILSYFLIPLATWIAATIVREIVIQTLH